MDKLDYIIKCVMNWQLTHIPVSGVISGEDQISPEDAKRQIKSLFLEIHLAAHNEAGSKAEAMKLFEKKVKEL